MAQPAQIAQPNPAKIEASAHSSDSSLREQALGHLFLGQLLAFMWRNGARDIEVLKSEVDRGGYDIVLEANGVIRHVQLKSSFRGSKVREVDVSTKLLRKPGGCILWLEFDRESLAIERFYWFGGKAGTALPDLGPADFPPLQGQQRGRKERAPDPSGPDQGTVRDARQCQRSGRKAIRLAHSVSGLRPNRARNSVIFLALTGTECGHSNLLHVSAIDQFSRFFSEPDDVAHRIWSLCKAAL